MKLSDILKQSGGDAEKGVELLLKASGSRSSDCSRFTVHDYAQTWHIASEEAGFTVPKKVCTKKQANQIAAILSENSRANPIIEDESGSANCSDTDKYATRPKL